MVTYAKDMKCSHVPESWYTIKRKNESKFIIFYHFIGCNNKDHLNYSSFYTNVTYLSVLKDTWFCHMIYNWTGAEDETAWYDRLIFFPCPHKHGSFS